MLTLFNHDRSNKREDERVILREKDSLRAGLAYMKFYNNNNLLKNLERM